MGASLSELAEWLADEVRARRWSYSELARQAGLSPAGISQVMSGRNNPGLQFCFGVARALDEPPEKVLRLAGFLPLRAERDEALEEIVHHYARMTPEGREYFRLIARAMGNAGQAVLGHGMGEPEGGM
jgi:transcriptional regulator with XRE-family HTH domain